MDDLEEKVAAIRESVKDAFGDFYVVELVGSRMRVRSFLSDSLSASLISFVSELGAVFEGCILNDGAVFAVFSV